MIRHLNSMWNENRRKEKDIVQTMDSARTERDTYFVQSRVTGV